MSSSKMRFGLIGTGAIAQSYATAFENHAEAELVGVADIRLDAAEAFGQKAKCPAFEDYREMIERSDCESVIVSTPPATHPEICGYLLALDINVLCEKPLAITTSEARKMLDAAESSNATLTMASKFRYTCDIIEAKSLVQQGVIGDVVLFENAFTAHVDMSQRWNSDPTVSGGGVLIDNGTHSVDIIRYFLGPIAEIRVVEGKRVQDIPVEDTVSIFARNMDGVMASIDLSWSINKELANYVSIYGSEGTLHVGWKESKYRRAGESEWTVFGGGYDKLQAFRNQLKNFTRAIRGLEPLCITLQDALASVEVVNTCYESLWQSDWSSVPSELSAAIG